jgi:hypothetical protein
MKRLLALLLAVLAGLSLAMAPAGIAATLPTWGDYSMMLATTGSAGQYWSGDQAGGKWEWDSVSATESRISWGDPAKWPPTYHEQFVHQADTSGDWARLPGWFDHGTFYAVSTTTEWQAAADCRTGRTALPTGGAQHYVRWQIPVAPYCLYAEGTITEQSSVKVMHFQHQQVWSPPAACGTNAYGWTAPSCITQWESWSDDIGTPFALKLERTATLAKGLGMAFRIRQTFPSVWAADLKYVRAW